VLFRELQEVGYVGGISQLKAFLAPYKRPEPEPLVRFETPPGKQMQADFTVIRRGREPLLALVATMGYSRASFVRFTAREDAATLCECLREALVYFGGTPEHVLFDNAKSVVIERDAFGEGQHCWNAQLLALAEAYGFTPKVCRPYRAKTKGKVERFNRYLKESFVVPLAATLKQSGLKLDVQAANAHIGRWLAEVANVRVHATTGERPAVRLAAEQAVLLPLPTQAPVLSAPDNRRALPCESLQHPLAVYDALLEDAL
jgi:transposase